MKKIPFFLLASLLGVVCSFPTHAASPCYTPVEHKAEGWLRLHSQLMVITVTCKQGSNGEALTPFYTDFTKQHIAVLRNAEQTLMRHYKKNGGKEIARLDSPRTRLGNDYGQKIADLSAPRFCAAYRDRVSAFHGAALTRVEQEVQLMMLAERPSEPLCGAVGQQKH